MAGSTSKSAWTGFERAIAADFAAVTGKNITRNPLSGANNRSDDGSPRAGDIITPPGMDILVEAKYRATHAHHTLFKDAVADAVKNGINPLRVILATRVKRDRGYLVTIDKNLFFRLLALPGALDIFDKVPDAKAS